MAIHHFLCLIWPPTLAARRQDTFASETLSRLSLLHSSKTLGFRTLWLLLLFTATSTAFSIFRFKELLSVSFFIAQGAFSVSCFFVAEDVFSVFSFFVADDVFPVSCFFVAADYASSRLQVPFQFCASSQLSKRPWFPALLQQKGCPQLCSLQLKVYPQFSPLQQVFWSPLSSASW